MFDLEQQISEWRKQMLAAGIKSRATLNELELHLRDEIQRQVKAGCSEPAAFKNSSRQIGAAENLQHEFAKLEKTPVRKFGIFVMLIGLNFLVAAFFAAGNDGAAHNNSFAGAFGGSLIFAVGLYLAFFRFTLGVGREVRNWQIVGLAFSWISVLIAFAPVALSSLPELGASFWPAAMFSVDFFACCLPLLGWQLIANKLPVVRARRTRMLIGIASCLFGIGFVALIMIVNNHSEHASMLCQLLAGLMFLLVWPLLAVLGGVGYGLAEAARREKIAVH